MMNADLFIYHYGEFFAACIAQALAQRTPLWAVRDRAREKRRISARKRYRMRLRPSPEAKALRKWKAANARRIAIAKKKRGLR